MNDTHNNGLEEHEAGSLAAEQSETRMRQALDRLSGDRSPPERSSADRSSGDKNGKERHPERPQAARATTSAAGFHPSGQRRHRYVQDGDVPVVQISHARDRRPHPGPASTSPVVSAPDIGGTVLAQERGARLRAEQSLERAQATIHSLETRLGHAEITQREALDLARSREQQEIALRAEFEQQATRLQALQADVERAEARLRETEAALAVARQAAEPVSTGWDEDWRGDEPILRPRTKAAPAEPLPEKRMQKEKVLLPLDPPEEPEPVKWWLPKVAKGRK